MVGGCGQSDEGQGTTLVTLTDPGPGIFPELDLACANDPPPSGEEVRVGIAPEVLDSGEWQMFFSPPSGPCTLLIRLRDEYTGETICLQEEDFVVSEVGDTEVRVTADDCEPATMP